jgi:nucleotide-binding universal stress UspA family protein
MSGFARIVLATDFSAPARAALERAAAIAARFGSRLYILHALDEPGPVLSTPPLDDGRIDAFFELAEKRTSAERAALGSTATPPAVIECVRIGKPGDEVPAFAEEKDADLIVIGTRGRTGLGRLFVGSVAESVLRRAPCAVLVVREAISRHPGAPVARRALAAIDFSEGSRAALRAALALASVEGGEVEALHVVEDSATLAAMHLAAADPLQVQRSLFDVVRKNLDGLVAEIAPAGGVRQRVETGQPRTVVPRLAAAEGFDVIACGTHGRSGIKRAIFGSVAEELIRSSSVPVLALREGAAAARWLAKPAERREAA